MRYDQDVDVAEHLRSLIAAEPAIVCAWLYGSVARGTERPDSDVDLALLVDVPVATDPWSWRWELEARFSGALRRQVQVILFDRAPADLARRVLRDGQLLADRDHARRVAAEVRKRAEYFDMTPTWRRIRRLPRGVAP